MTTTTTKPFDIAIVGGGISGLTLAIGLLQQNVPVTVYEAASKFGEIGAGVGFGPNAVRALALISPELPQKLDRLITYGWESQRMNWFRARVGDARKAGPDGVLRQEWKGQKNEGKKVGDPLFDVGYTDADGVKGGVHRAHLLDELLKLLPASVSHLGKRLVSIDPADDESESSSGGDVVLHFADGTSVRHSAVVGCDGIKSRTRDILLKGEAKAVFSGKYAYRGLIPMDKATEMLGAEIAQNCQMYMGHHGHLLTYPIEKGRTMNVVAFSSCDTWSNPDWVVSTSKEKMLSDFAHWGPDVAAIISAMEKRDIWALFDHPPAPTYFGLAPRICLLGDAAHASTPHQGAGAGMCIEDCYVLSRLLGEVQGAGDIGKAFRAYDAARRPRTQKLVSTSREAAMLYEFELVGDDLEAIEENFTTRMKWIWDVDLQEELERAFTILRS